MHHWNKSNIINVKIFISVKEVQMTVKMGDKQLGINILRKHSISYRGMNKKIQ